MEVIQKKGEKIEVTKTVENKEIYTVGQIIENIARYGESELQAKTQKEYFERLLAEYQKK